MAESSQLVSLAEAGNRPLAEVGGKAQALGRLMAFGAPVPPGFVVPPEAKLNSRSAAIDAATNRLSSPFLAVRSSAAGEDGDIQSWAGQFESYLYVLPANVQARIKDSRASGHSTRAQAYAGGANMPVAVIVQAMVPAESAGVLFSVNPVTKNPNELMIEAVWGLGELLVSGLATPDNYLVAKNSTALIDQTVATKTVMMVGADNGPIERPVPRERQTKPVLERSQLTELSELARRLESDFGYPLDIEFAYTREKLYILQARPITTL